MPFEPVTTPVVTLVPSPQLIEAVKSSWVAERLLSVKVATVVSVASAVASVPENVAAEPVRSGSKISAVLCAVALAVPGAVLAQDDGDLFRTAGRGVNVAAADGE